MTDRNVKINRYLMGLKPYRVSDSSRLTYRQKLDYLKLDWNESTIPPSPKVIQALMQVLQIGALNFYPDVTASELRTKLSSYVGLDVSLIQVFNGSDEALRMVCEVFLDAGDQVLFRDPTYAQIEPFIISRGARIVRFTGDSPITPNSEKYRDWLRQNSIALVYIVNPNNPTGLLYEQDLIESLCAEFPRTLFLVDEAYFEFAGYTVVSLVNKYPNLLIARTFSKAFGLAGLRIGYLLAAPALLASMDLIRNGKDVNLLGQIAAAAALDDLPYMQAYVDEVIGTRNWLCQALRGLGVEVFDSRANFLLVRVADARRIEQSLKENKILVRDRSSMAQLENTFRVSIGTRTQMTRFFETFAALL